MDSQSKISFVMPCYNCGEYIYRNLKEVIRTLNKFKFNYEIVAIDDGSRDNTFNEAKEIKSSKLKVYRYKENKGKGYALKYGAKKATGDYITFIDVDLDIHPRQFLTLVKYMEDNNADIVIGSKRHPESQVDYPLKRRILSYLYHKFVNILFGINVKDTQTGFKLIKKECVDKIMPKIAIKRFAFDLELLVVARKYGFKIVEAPIILKPLFKDSSVNWKATKFMLLDTLGIAYRNYILKWYEWDPIEKNSILMMAWRDIKNPTKGGAEVVTHELLKRWTKVGYKCVLYSSAFPRCKNEEVVDGYNIVRGGGRLGTYWKAYRFYKNNAKNFDLVIDQVNTIPYFSPLYVKCKRMSYFNQLCREIWFYEMPFPISLIGYLAESFYLRLYKDVPCMTISESSKKDLQKHGFDEVYTFPMGIDFKPLDEVPEKEKNSLIYVGRLKKSKRVHHIIKSLFYVKEKIPDVKLYIVGDGDKKYKKYLNGLIKSYRLENNVVLKGYLSFEERNKLMSMVEAILVASVKEGWGLIVTEANAMGTSAIVYDADGLRDSVKNNETGLIVEPSPNHMSEAIVNYLRNEELKMRLSKNALMDAGNYNWDRSAEKALKMIEQ